MESVEIQKTDSHSSHRPWKSPGDSHIPSGPTILLILTTGDQTSFGKVSPMSPGHNVTYDPGRTLGTPDKDSRNQYQHPSNPHLERSRVPGRVHIAMADVADHRQFDRHHDSRDSCGDPEIVDQI